MAVVTSGRYTPPSTSESPPGAGERFGARMVVGPAHPRSRCGPSTRRPSRGRARRASRTRRAVPRGVQRDRFNARRLAQSPPLVAEPFGSARDAPASSTAIRPDRGSAQTERRALRRHALRTQRGEHVQGGSGNTRAPRAWSWAVSARPPFASAVTPRATVSVPAAKSVSDHCKPSTSLLRGPGRTSIRTAPSRSPATCARLWPGHSSSMPLDPRGRRAPRRGSLDCGR